MKIVPRFALVVMICAASSAMAQEPAPSPQPSPPAITDPDTDVHVSAYSWSKLAAGAPDSAIRFGGGVELRGPLAFGQNKSFGAVGLRIDVDTLPDKGAAAFEDLGTWGNYAEVEGFFTKRIGSLAVAGGKVTTSAIIAGRTTFGVLGNTDDDPPRRALRGYGAGFELAWLRGGALDSVSAIYGRDEAVGARAWGQLRVKGSLTLRGPMRFVGEFGIGFGPASIAGEQRDYMTAGLGVNLTQLFPK